LYKHIGLYAYRRSTLLVLAALDPTPPERAESLEQRRALEHGIRIKAVETTHDTIHVDTPADLEDARRLISTPAGSASTMGERGLGRMTAGRQQNRSWSA